MINQSIYQYTKGGHAYCLLRSLLRPSEALRETVEAVLSNPVEPHPRRGNLAAGFFLNPPVLGLHLRQRHGARVQLGPGVLLGVSPGLDLLASAAAPSVERQRQMDQMPQIRSADRLAAGIRKIASCKSPPGCALPLRTVWLWGWGVH